MIYSGHKTIAAAKRDAPQAVYRPRVVKLSDGTFDSYPAGHPIPAGSVIVTFFKNGKWVKAP